MNEWLTALAILAPLLGVWIGGVLERRSRSEERERLERWELVKDSSRILGRVGLLLRTSDPKTYHLFVLPGSDSATKITEKSDEAGALAPMMSELAVRWPAAADDLLILEKELGMLAINLGLVVLTSDDPESDQLDPAIRSHGKATAALDRLTKRLHSREPAIN